MIYHYTDLNAAKSITENAQIWLTDYRFLNDKEEFLKGYDLLLDALSEYQDCAEEYPKELIECFSRAVENIREDNFSNFERNNIFVSSFSKTKDSLSQWRSYGMYSLELDEAFVGAEDIHLLDCHYLQNEGDAIEYANTIIRFHIMPALLNLWVKGKPFSVDLKLSSLVDIYALSFKHEAFYDENEVRFVVSCSPDDERINFRVRGQLLIPYIALEFKPQLLKSIMVGPVENQVLACDSFAMFSRKISRIVRQNKNNIDYALVIENSHIPYRNI